MYSGETPPHAPVTGGGFSPEGRPQPQGESNTSFPIALVCTTGCQILASASNNQGRFDRVVRKGGSLQV